MLTTFICSIQHLNSLPAIKTWASKQLRATNHSFSLSSQGKIVRRNTTFSQADKTGLDGPSYPMLDKFSRDTCGFYLSVPLGKEGDVRIKPDFTGHNRLLAHT